MIYFLISVVILVFVFLFFGRPRPSLPVTIADIETITGRTTLYHYRYKLPRGKGVVALVHGFCENHLYFQSVA